LTIGLVILTVIFSIPIVGSLLLMYGYTVITSE
jgi:hypothetical protein